jgi:hypothetical protein
MAVVLSFFNLFLKIASSIAVHSEVGSLYQNLFQSHSSWKVNIQHSFPDHHDLETECYFAAAIGHFIASLTRAKNESHFSFDNKTENCVAWFSFYFIPFIKDGQMVCFILNKKFHNVKIKFFFR